VAVEAFFCVLGKGLTPVTSPFTREALQPLLTTPGPILDAVTAIGQVILNTGTTYTDDARFPPAEMLHRPPDLLNLDKLRIDLRGQFDKSLCNDTTPISDTTLMFAMLEVMFEVSFLDIPWTTLP
jgi:hypothetical protein